MPHSYRRPLFLLAAGLCLTPWISPPIALALGLVVGQTIGSPFLPKQRRFSTLLLQVCVVGLGFGMNLEQAVTTTREGIVLTVASIVGTMVIGTVLGRVLRVERTTTHLVSSGTAICGGSAIAAVGPVIGATDVQMSVSLAIVFVLNAVALFVFPVIGHALDLTQTQFGLWAAVAIHDTSAVVGAASAYGVDALQVASTVKLSRALWIVPLALMSAWTMRGTATRVTIPWFIVAFVGAMALATYVPAVAAVGPAAVSLARTGMTLTLFLIGSSLDRTSLRSIGVRPLVLGVVLWLLIAGGTLLAVVAGRT